MGSIRFTEEEEEILFEFVCNQLSDGIPLKEILDGVGMPYWGTFHKWLERTPERHAKYARARNSFADSIAAETLTIADDPGMATMLDKEIARLRIDTRKWVAGVFRPRVYGQKVAVGGAEDLPPIQTIDATKLSTEALRQISEAMRIEKPDTE